MLFLPVSASSERLFCTRACHSTGPAECYAACLCCRLAGAHVLYALAHPNRTQTQQVKTQIIAHDKEVYDIAFASDNPNVFASVGADGSLRVFDLRCVTVVCSHGLACARAKGSLLSMYCARAASVCFARRRFKRALLMSLAWQLCRQGLNCGLLFVSPLARCLWGPSSLISTFPHGRTATQGLEALQDPVRRREPALEAQLEQARLKLPRCVPLLRLATRIGSACLHSSCTIASAHNFSAAFQPADPSSLSLSPRICRPILRRIPISSQLVTNSAPPIPIPPPSNHGAGRQEGGGD